MRDIAQGTSQTKDREGEGKHCPTTKHLAVNDSPIHSAICITFPWQWFSSRQWFWAVPTRTRKPQLVVPNERNVQAMAQTVTPSLFLSLDKQDEGGPHDLFIQSCSSWWLRSRSKKETESQRDDHLCVWVRGA
jgi:hypothetical protein